MPRGAPKSAMERMGALGLNLDKPQARKEVNMPQEKNMKAPESAMERMAGLGLNLDKPPSASAATTKVSSQGATRAAKPQTLADALGVSTKVVNFSQEFGENPIREGHSAAKYLKNPQTLAEALGVMTKVVNFTKSFGNNPIHKGHSAAKYLADAKTQEKQQYLSDMKSRAATNLIKPKAVDQHGTPGKNGEGMDPMGGDKDPEITDANLKLGELKGDLYDLFNFVQRSVEGGMKQISQEAVALKKQDGRHWDAMSGIMDQLQASSARETVLNKNLTESMSALIVEQARLKETELKFNSAQSLLELKQDDLFTAMGRISNLEAERVKLQQGSKNLDVATNKLYNAQTLLQRDSVSLREANATHSKNLKELSKREARLQEKAVAAQQERDEVLKKLKGIETSLATSRTAFKQARGHVSELQATSKDLEERVKIADAENAKVGQAVFTLSSQGKQQSSQATDLAGQLSSTEIRVTGLRKELGKSNAALEVAKRQREEAESRVERTEVLLGSHEQLIQKTGEKVGMIGSEVKKLRNENQALAAQSDVLVQEKQSLESLVEALRDSMADHVSQMEAADAREVKLCEQGTLAQGELANAQLQLKDVELALPATEAALTEARGSLQEVQTKVKELEARVTILQESKKQMFRERSTFQDQNELQQEQLVTVTKDLEESAQLTAALRKELDESIAVLKSVESLQLETETQAKESESLLSTHRQDLETAHIRIAAFEEAMENISGQVAGRDIVASNLCEVENQFKLLHQAEAAEKGNADKLAEAVAREASLQEAADMVQTNLENAEARGKELDETLSTQMQDMDAASWRIDALKAEFDDTTQGRTRDIEYHLEETKSTKKWAALSLVGVAAIFACAVSVTHIAVHTTVTGDAE